MNAEMIGTVLKEYGLSWAINRCLYSAKLKMISTLNGTDRFFEKKVKYPFRLEIFSFNIHEIQDFIQHLPSKKKDELIDRADKACVGGIVGFSSFELDYGYPINWQLNPLTGKACDIHDKWYDIPDFDAERGDIKAIWEASRFSHFITLARAYLLTGNRKYYIAFSEQLADWIEKNPYSYGANFKCGQECSLRMVNGLLAYTVFKDCGQATDEDKGNIETLILRCYRKILSNFFYAYKCIKNNHTLSELMGMAVGAWCCGDEKRLAYAFYTMDEVIYEQFTEDGGYKQYSFNYERLALQDMEVILSIEKKTGHCLNDNTKNKLLKAATLMYQCQDESGDMPNYGANDGALVFPVTSCGYRDFRPVIGAVIARIAGKSVYEAGNYDEEILWFYPEYNKTEHNCANEKKLSKAFYEAGLFTLREKDSWAMIILNDYKSRPAHMDQLHFDLWIDGVNVLCDGGTYSYEGNTVKKLRSASGHNTVVIKETEQMNSHGPFMIYGWTKRMKYSWMPNEFYGHMKSRNGYEHIRDVKKTNRGYEITDRVLSRNNRSYKILYHTPCEVQKKDSSIELVYNGRVFCEIECNRKVKIRKAVRSLFYMKTDEINEIVVEGSKVESATVKIRIKNVRR